MPDAYPDTHKGIGAWMVPIGQAAYGLQASLRDPLYLLMVVCVLVLLIVCANMANLLTARAISRQKELGVGMALGASPRRLVQQLLVEVLLLAGLGAAVGILLAWFLGGSLYRVLPAMEPSIRAAIDPLLHVEPTVNVAAFMVLISFGAALLSTVLPTFSMGRMNINQTLKEGGRSGTSGVRSHRARGALVMLEVAVAALTLCGAALAVQSFQKFATLYPGFDSRDVLVAHFYLSTNGYSLSQEKQFCRNLRLRLEGAPELCGHSSAIPFWNRKRPGRGGRIVAGSGRGALFAAGYRGSRIL
jgi:hypothetical protein